MSALRKSGLGWRTWHRNFSAALAWTNQRPTRQRGPYLTPNARFDKLLHLPEAANAGKAINEALRGIEVDFGPEIADTFCNFALVC